MAHWIKSKEQTLQMAHYTYGLGIGLVMGGFLDAYANVPKKALIAGAITLVISIALFIWANRKNSKK